MKAKSMIRIEIIALLLAFVCLPAYIAIRLDAFCRGCCRLNGSFCAAVAAGMCASALLCGWAWAMRMEKCHAVKGK